MPSCPFCRRYPYKTECPSYFYHVESCKKSYVEGQRKRDEKALEEIGVLNDIIRGLEDNLKESRSQQDREKVQASIIHHLKERDKKQDEEMKRMREELSLLRDNIIQGAKRMREEMIQGFDAVIEGQKASSIAICEFVAQAKNSGLVFYSNDGVGVVNPYVTYPVSYPLNDSLEACIFYKSLTLTPEQITDEGIVLGCILKVLDKEKEIHDFPVFFRDFLTTLEGQAKKYRAGEKIIRLIASYRGEELPPPIKRARIALH